MNNIDDESNKEYQKNEKIKSPKIIRKNKKSGIISPIKIVNINSPNTKTMISPRINTCNCNSNEFTNKEILKSINSEMNDKVNESEINENKNDDCEIDKMDKKISKCTKAVSTICKTIKDILLFLKRLIS